MFVSAAIGKSYPMLVVDKVFEANFELCISENALTEFERVLQYPKFIKKKAFKEKSENLLHNMKIFGTFYYPQFSLSVLKDKSDNKFLELAVEAKADYLITGNHLDFNIEVFQNVKIVSPKNFWELYEKNNL